MSLEDDHPPKLIPIPEPTEAGFYETKWRAVYHKKRTVGLNLGGLEELLIKYWQTQTNNAPKPRMMSKILLPLAIANSMLLSDKHQDQTILNLESIVQKISGNQQAATGFKVLVVGGPEAPFFGPCVKKE